MEAERPLITLTACVRVGEYLFCTWALANGYARNLVLDRIDNDGNYEPANCRWVGRVESQRNRRNVRKATYDGVTKPIVEWAGSDECVVSNSTLQWRVKHGVDIGTAMCTAPYGLKRHTRGTAETPYAEMSSTTAGSADAFQAYHIGSGDQEE